MIIKNIRLFCLCFALLFSIVNLNAEETATPVKIELIQEDETIQPGHPFWVALHFNMEKGWHSYWKNPGDSGAPPTIDWQLPAGFEVLNVEWPVPEKFTVDGLVGYGYEKETLLLAEIKAPENLTPETTTQIAAKIKWLVCNESSCLPGENQATLSLPVKNETPKHKTDTASQFTTARDNLPISIESIQTTRQKDKIELHLNHIEQLEASTLEKLSVSFYPIKQDTIDTTNEPEILHKTTKDLTVTLKPGKEALGSTLEGLLILSDGKENLYTYEVFAPLAENDTHVAFHDGKPASSITSTSSSTQFDGGIALAIVFAFVGGLLLNLMPCVLPVMSIKVLSFVKMAGENRWLTLKHGLAFGFGVLLSFWTLAAAMLTLQSYGNAVGWGFQLQDPLFVAILAAVLFVFSLSLFGLFEVGTKVSSIAGQAQSDTREAGYTGSFFSGVLATAIATPCTGPFLGSAVGFAVTLPVIWSMIIFTSLGLGMALPYVLLSAFPSLLSFVPKPGAWMVTFKEITGFLVLATVLWLLWVFGAETSTQALTIMLASLLIFALGGWVYGKWSTGMVKKPIRIISYAIVLACLTAGTYGIIKSTTLDSTTTHTSEVADGWEPFSPERVEELRQQGTPVLIDFTAKWCLICQANHVVLSTDSTSKALEEAGVVKMKADWTKNDPVITEALKKFGRNSVPLYVLYGSDPQEEPKILPQVLTSEIVEQHLDEIAEK